jgi:hypothetical protein
VPVESDLEDRVSARKKWGNAEADQGYHRIGVRLDDDQSHFVNVGLR